jgi:hypothetical protein
MLAEGDARMHNPLLTAPRWDVLDEAKLPQILDVMVDNHPDPDRLLACKPGFYLRPAEGDRLEAYMVNDDDEPVTIGFFPRTALLKVDVNHPIAMN